MVDLCVLIVCIIYEHNFVQTSYGMGVVCGYPPGRDGAKTLLLASFRIGARLGGSRLVRSKPYDFLLLLPLEDAVGRQ